MLDAPWPSVVMDARYGLTSKLRGGGMRAALYTDLASLVLTEAGRVEKDAREHIDELISIRERLDALIRELREGHNYWANDCGAQHPAIPDR